MSLCRMVIPLRPKPKERPQHGRFSKGFTPKSTREYEEAVKHYYERDCGLPPTDKPVMVTFMFNFAVPKSYSKKEQAKKLQGTCPYSIRPDLDNIEKAAMDALNGLAFKDDAQVVGKLSLKRFWMHNSIMITIDEMEEIDYEHGVFAGYGKAEQGDGGSGRSAAGSV